MNTNKNALIRCAEGLLGIYFKDGKYFYDGVNHDKKYFCQNLLCWSDEDIERIFRYMFEILEGVEVSQSLEMTNYLDDFLSTNLHIHTILHKIA